MNGIGKELSKEWIDYMCNPEKGFVDFCKYKNDDKCPMTCNYATRGNGINPEGNVTPAKFAEMYQKTK